jgi:hypothetical protein
MPPSPWNLMQEKGQTAMMETTFLTVGTRLSLSRFLSGMMRL